MTKLEIIYATNTTAEHEVGVREIRHTNRGKRVDEYQEADLLPGVGYSWCASFIAWVMLMTLGRALCDLVWLRSASCDQILTWARRMKIIASAPTPGCMGLVMASRNDATHIFKVEKLLNGAVQTVEGNTNDDGSREGNGVYRRRRVLDPRYTWLDWARLLPVGASLPGTVQPPKPKPALSALPKSPFDGCPTLDLVDANGRLMTIVPVHEGRSWLPSEQWAKWMQADLEWQMSTQSVLIDHREVAAQPILHDGHSYLPVTKLAAHNGLKAQFDDKARKVVISR